MKGIRRHGVGWQASVYVTGMPRAYQAFTIETPEDEMQAWRRSTKARLELARGEAVVVGRIPAGTFAADAQRYLKAVRAMPDYRGRAYDIQLWVDVFGGRRTASIRPHEIRAQRDQWLTVGPRRRYDRAARVWRAVREPLAASTVNHRLRALENLYTVLTPQGYNPVRDVPEAMEPAPEDRSVPYPVIDAILAVMPDRGRAARGEKRPALSVSKTLLRFMAYTGIPLSQTLAMTPADIDLELVAVRTIGRRKGKGAKGGWKPLPADAKPALEALRRIAPVRTFSRSSLRKSWLRGCRALELPPIRPYDLRHSFATRVLDDTQDLKATQMLLNHADARTTERYAQRAIPAWLAAAAARVGTQAQGSGLEAQSTLAQSAGTMARREDQKQPEKSREKQGRR